ncbi:MAG: hypothetical protein ACJ74Z_20075 [Bryobacteraceae bacterium]
MAAHSSEDGSPQIWKKPAARGCEIQLTKGRGGNQMESADGAYVYYLKSGERALWRVPAAADENLSVLSPDTPIAVRAWNP